MPETPILSVLAFHLSRVLNIIPHQCGETRDEEWASLSCLVGRVGTLRAFTCQTELLLSRVFAAKPLQPVSFCQFYEDLNERRTFCSMFERCFYRWRCLELKIHRSACFCVSFFFIYYFLNKTKFISLKSAVKSFKTNDLGFECVMTKSGESEKC